MLNFGDSITVGVGSSSINKSWVGLLTPINQGVSGAQAADVSQKCIGITSNIDEVYTLMVGTNDARQYKDDSIKKSYYKKFLQSVIAWLYYPTKVLAKDCVLTGNWNNTLAFASGKNTTQTGSSALATVTGKKIYIGYYLQNDLATVNSLANVYIDDLLVGTYTCSAPAMNTINGATYAPACEVYDVSAGTHEVKIVIASSGKTVYLNYVIGNEQTHSNLKISNIIKYSANGYLAYGITQSTIESYNLMIKEVANNFSLNVIDNFNTLNPMTDLADEVHPNNAGHLKIYNNFK